MIEILYNADPNRPEETNHMGRMINSTEQRIKQFSSWDLALAFWLDCTSPISEIPINPEIASHCEAEKNVYLESLI